jgi:hypothetical protein
MLVIGHLAPGNPERVIFSSRPVLQPDYTAALTEARRLAGIEPTKEYIIFTACTSVKAKPVELVVKTF